MNFLLIQSLKKPSEKLLSEVLGKNQKIKLNNRLNLFVSENNINDCFFKDKDIAGYVMGYARSYLLNSSDSINHNLFTAKDISNKKWPLNDDFTGSFSMLTYCKKSQQISISNDCVGYHPIFYFIKNDELIISSSLILIGAILGESTDEIGVLEKLISGAFCTFGKRTTVKNVSSLLPGEAIYLNSSNFFEIDKKYDNTLYNGIIDKSTKSIAKDVSDLISKEIDICLLNKNTTVAVSGGLDSRVILGHISSTKKVNCVTYGDSDFYETKIAKKCAKKVNGNFSSYGIYEYEFPSKKILKDYILKTEATGLQCWVPIIEGVKKTYHNEPFLLGDISDILTGKKFDFIKGRMSKIYVFLKYTLLFRKIPFKLNSDQAFNNWKKEKSDVYISKLKNLNYDFNLETAKISLQNDLNEIFERISAHNVKYYEQLNELFSIYTHARFPMAKQLIITKKKFLPQAPIMSMQMMRFSTKINPNEKILFKLLDEILNLDKMKKFSNIPTAQIPFIPYKFSRIVKLPIWAIRSFFDQIMIKRQMRLKNPKARNRLLKSINWVEAYNQKDGLKNISDYFENDILGLRERCIKTYNMRSQMKSWPLSTIDLISLASLNIEQELIGELKDLK